MGWGRVEWAFFGARWVELLIYIFHKYNMRYQRFMRVQLQRYRQWKSEIVGILDNKLTEVVA